MYCATDDEDSIEEGVERVKKILADNYVRPDEAEKIKFMITEKGSFTVIDRVQVTVDVINGICFADLMNLGMGSIPISSEYVKNNENFFLVVFGALLNWAMEIFLNVRTSRSEGQ
jgi:ATP-dependent Lon protease